MDSPSKKCPKCGSDIQIPEGLKRSTLFCKACGKRVYLMSETPSFKQADSPENLETSALENSQSKTSRLRSSGLSVRMHQWAPPEETNPLFTIWLHPSLTIRRILKTNPKKHVLALSALFGISHFSQTIALGLEQHDLFSLVWRFPLCIVGGAVLGALYCYPMGFLISITGRLMGGKADCEASRAAWAWASIANLPIILINLFLPISQLLEQPWARDVTFLAHYILVRITLVIYMLIIFSCISEIHKFSVFKAFVTLSIVATITYYMDDFLGLLLFSL